MHTGASSCDMWRRLSNLEHEDIIEFNLPHVDNLNKKNDPFYSRCYIPISTTMKLGKSRLLSQECYLYA
jgi:hypothetical protein